MEQASIAQEKQRDFNIEACPEVIQHLKSAAHITSGSRERAEARVLMLLTRLQLGLFADHTIPFDFMDIAIAISDEPVASQQLNLIVALIGNGDVVGENKA